MTQRIYTFNKKQYNVITNTMYTIFTIYKVLLKFSKIDFKVERLILTNNNEYYVYIKFSKNQSRKVHLFHSLN